jgi:uncharacterized phage-like protein YoqJ
MRETTCCFTGHRAVFQEDAPGLPAKLREEIIKAYSEGFRKFIFGCALGFDTIAAQAVLDLKDRLPGISLSAALPCRNYDRFWNRENSIRLKKILERSDEVICVSEGYYRGCMHQRNRFMVKNSSRCICYLRKNSGGTFYTVKEAEKSGLQIVRL